MFFTDGANLQLMFPDAPVQELELIVKHSPDFDQALEVLCSTDLEHLVKPLNFQTVQLCQVFSLFAEQELAESLTKCLPICIVPGGRLNSLLKSCIILKTT